MLRVLFVIVNVIFISMILFVSNKETIFPSIFSFFSIQYIYILKQYIEEKSTEEKIIRRESFILFMLLLLLGVLQNEIILFILQNIIFLILIFSIFVGLYYFFKKFQNFYLFYFLGVLNILLLLINRIIDLSKNVSPEIIISESTVTLTILYILYTFLDYKYKLKTFEKYYIEENYINEKSSTIGMNIYIFLILFLSMIISGILMNWDMMKEKFPYIVEKISYLNFLFNFSLLLSLSIFLLCKKRKIISYLKVIIYFLIVMVFYKYDIKYDLYENICIIFISNLLYEILLNYQETLMFKDDFIILLKYKNQKIKIKNSEKIKVIYLKGNLIINFLRFLNGKKQIYITDGNKEIYFGYFISQKKYKEILALLSKVHQE
jgi:membrane protein